MACPRRCDTCVVSDADALLALAADIERRDGAVAGELELVLDLAARSDEIRARAEQIQLLVESVPGETATLDRNEAEARDARAAAVGAVASAESRVAELEHGRFAAPETRAAAERDLARSREIAAESTSRLERLALDRASLLEAESTARADALELVREAHEVASRLQAVARVSRSGREAPGQDLAQVVEWGSRVHAALFVVRGQLESERDRLVREANELGCAVLGEQFAGANVALVRRRLEEALRP